MIMSREGHEILNLKWLRILAEKMKLEKSP